jgi:two-component system, LuxR family, response regulator FixJ
MGRNHLSRTPAGGTGRSSMSAPAAPSNAVVYIVDDEEAVADSVSMLLRSVGLQTRTFADARAFLKDYLPEMAGCLVLDVRMPKMGGLELQDELNRMRCALPIIFVTGHGDVPMAVEAMRAGAIDFLQKPFNDDELIRRVQKALEEDAAQRAVLKQREEIERRWSELTEREREIAQRIAEGQANKVMASELSISERTVELHRAHVMQKMGVRSLAQLVRMLLSLGPAA